MKLCTCCNQTKDFTAFYKNKARADGHTIYCSACTSQRSKEWKQNNKERVAAYDKAWQQANKDKKSKNYKKYQVNKTFPIFVWRQ